MAFKRWTVRVRLSPPPKKAPVGAFFGGGDKARNRTGAAQPRLFVLAQRALRRRRKPRLSPRDAGCPFGGGDKARNRTGAARRRKANFASGAQKARRFALLPAPPLPEKSLLCKSFSGGYEVEIIPSSTVSDPPSLVRAVGCPLAPLRGGLPSRAAPRGQRSLCSSSSRKFLLRKSFSGGYEVVVTLIRRLCRHLPLGKGEDLGRRECSCSVLSSAFCIFNSRSGEGLKEEACGSPP